MRSFSLSFLILTLLSACMSGPVEKTGNQPVPYTLISSSPLFNKKHVSLTIDSSGHSLLIRLRLKDMESFPFPVNATYKDTLTHTAFHFDFLCDGKNILSDFCSLNNSILKFGKDTAASARLSLSTDTVNLRKGWEYDLKIPFYAFHNLSHGKRSIELRISQKMFKDEYYEKEDSRDPILLYAEAPLLSGSLRFDIQVPLIYKSTLYGYGLQLKNDSSFSPAGMDNTIWKSSYPDIYWSVLYPENEFYCQTAYQTSTDTYDAKDTFCLYHYHPDDSIGIAVYDHDNLSRDDGLGYWKGATSYLEREPLRRISFGNIRYFDVRLKKNGPVN